MTVLMQRRERLQTIGDLHQLIGDGAIEMLHRQHKLLDKINDKLEDVTEILIAQAERLNAHRKYKDAEYIYTRIFSLSGSVRLDHLTIELASKLLFLYEETGNHSAAETIQEFLLRAVHDPGIDEDALNWVTEKLCQNYINFHDRVNNIVLGLGEDEWSSAEFARMAVFYRTATLDIDALSRAITGSQRTLIPKMALHIAAQVGAFSLTSMLIEEDDRDINLKDECGKTALHFAVQKGPCELIQVFLNAHADLEIIDDGGNTALLLAAGCTSERGSEIVKCLLDAGANANVRDQRYRTSLHLAARFGTPETVEILLDHKTEVNAMGIYDQTPLFEAIENVPFRGVPIARQLLHSGAKLKDSFTESVGYLMRAAQLGNAAMLNVFLSCEVNQGANANQGLADRTMALHAALEGPLATQGACISMLLKAGVIIEQKRKGRTALGTALRCGWLAAVRQLLDHGADVETEIKGERLLFYSVRRGDESATRLLLEKGADARLKDHNGEPPLSSSVARSQYAIVEMLLEADRHCLLTIDKEGNTALHQATVQDHEEHGGILSLLLKYCYGLWPYLNETNLDGYTPLHLAVSLKRFKLAKMVLAVQSIEDPYYFLATEKKAALQEFGSLLSRTTIHAGDSCFEAFEELKRFWRTLTSRPPLLVPVGPSLPEKQLVGTGEFLGV